MNCLLQLRWCTMIHSKQNPYYDLIHSKQNQYFIQNEIHIKIPTFPNKKITLIFSGGKAIVESLLVLRQ